MVAYYEVKVRYERMEEDRCKRVTETYLVNALSVTEAEFSANKELQPYVSHGDVEIVSVSASKYCELLLNEEDYYYKAKVEVRRLNEKSGRVSKACALSLLINANNIDSAYVLCKRRIGESLEDFKLTSISECPIVGVFNNVEP
jgi:hypothetical protein|nr:MAG TPA: protein of unknown function (DUF4494) [Caudoviricetes sp.]